MTEKKIYKRISAGMYQNETGDKLEVKAVNRQYSGTIKKPKYFLSRFNPSKKKFDYISGLFKTSKPLIFSYDIRDQLGVKYIHTCEFSPDGDSITLQPKPEGKRRTAA
jgi:hypothetical protein